VEGDGAALPAAPARGSEEKCGPQHGACGRQPPAREPVEGLVGVGEDVTDQPSERLRVPEAIEGPSIGPDQATLSVKASSYTTAPLDIRVHAASAAAHAERRPWRRARRGR